MPIRASRAPGRRANRRLDELDASPAPGRSRAIRRHWKPAALDESRLRLRLHPRRLHRRGGEVARNTSRAGDIFQVVLSPAPVGAVPGASGRRVPRAARAESVAVHVFPRCRRHAGGRLVAGDPRAPAGRPGHGAPDRRHAPARRARPKKTSRSKPNCWPIPKERAEHLMLIDLGRNDVGRVVRAGHGARSASSS